MFQSNRFISSGFPHFYSGPTAELIRAAKEMSPRISDIHFPRWKFEIGSDTVEIIVSPGVLKRQNGVPGGECLTPISDVSKRYARALPVSSVHAAKKSTRAKTRFQNVSQ